MEVFILPGNSIQNGLLDTRRACCTCMIVSSTVLLYHDCYRLNAMGKRVWWMCWRMYPFLECGVQYLCEGHSLHRVVWIIAIHEDSLKGMRKVSQEVPMLNVLDSTWILADSSTKCWQKIEGLAALGMVCSGAYLCKPITLLVHSGTGYCGISLVSGNFFWTPVPIRSPSKRTGEVSWG